MIIVPIWGKSQLSYRNEATRTVFNNLVQAYANGKGAPELEIVPLTGTPVIAEYYTTKKGGNPIIKIDQKLIEICFSMGKDSVNALAFILSHELSHYYKDDNWCMDYASFKFKSNPAFAKSLKNSSKNNEGKEAYADKDGLLHAGIAGYSPFNVFNKLIDAIYDKYKLQDNLVGYPTKARRKEINRDVRSDAQKWLSIFNSGLINIKIGNYKEAIDSLSYLSKKFPSREVFNNMGIAKTRKALLLKTKTYEEVHYPDRFLYPLEVENKSRLSQDDTRGLDDDKEEEYTKLLNEAEKDFQEAIRIDPHFTKGRINLACIYDLIGNPSFAIGIIKSLTPEEQNSIEAKKILAIAYYHNDQEVKAEELWKSINK